jgi:phospholipid-binding lipoprotein MlaA
VCPGPPCGGAGLRPGAARMQVLALGVAVLLLSACASLPAGERDPRDPFESYNRAMFAFNEGVDRAVVKPAARAYERLPRPVRDGAGNFFSNLDDVAVLVNNLLQGKLPDAANDAARLIFNSTIGVFGLLDVASPMGLPKNREDFGQTLGYWGVPSGPYLQLPFLGPSTVRDAPARVVDFELHPSNHLYRDHRRTWATLSAVEVVSIRASLLPMEDLLAAMSEDRYIAVRDLWLQRRDYLVRDGQSQAEDGLWLDELEQLEALEALEAEGRGDPVR